MKTIITAIATLVAMGGAAYLGAAPLSENSSGSISIVSISHDFGTFDADRLAFDIEVESAGIDAGGANAAELYAIPLPVDGASGLKSIPPTNVSDVIGDGYVALPLGVAPLPPPYEGVWVVRLFGDARELMPGKYRIMARITFQAANSGDNRTLAERHDPVMILEVFEPAHQRSASHRDCHCWDRWDCRDDCCDDCEITKEDVVATVAIYSGALIIAAVAESCSLHAGGTGLAPLFVLTIAGLLLPVLARRRRGAMRLITSRADEPSRRR